VINGADRLFFLRGADWQPLNDMGTAIKLDIIARNGLILYDEMR